MTSKDFLEKIFLKYGFDDFKWIDKNRIVIANWVRIKCIYGCPEFGKRASCQPNLPSVNQCKEFIHEYKEIVVFHFWKAFPNPNDRHNWMKEIDSRLLELEREVFLSGFVKAFVLLPDACQFCDECSETREKCKNPKKSRPTPEAMAIDVFSTVKSINFPIEVLRKPTEIMNRYAFLLIE